MLGIDRRWWRLASQDTARANAAEASRKLRAVLVAASLALIVASGGMATFEAGPLLMVAVAEGLPG